VPLSTACGKTQINDTENYRYPAVPINVVFLAADTKYKMANKQELICLVKLYFTHTQFTMMSVYSQHVHNATNVTTYYHHSIPQLYIQL